MVAASSNHPGGVNVGRVDGSVQFVSETVNTGTLQQGGTIGPGAGARWSRGPSPWGVWGAMGTVGEGETGNL